MLCMKINKLASDQVVKTFVNNPITLKTSIKYHKEYDRDTEQEILSLLEESDNAKDFSWESKIEDADEIEKAQGNMPQGLYDRRGKNKAISQLSDIEKLKAENRLLKAQTQMVMVSRPQTIVTTR